MLAIQGSARSTSKCEANVLPCKINHNGPVDACKRHWNPEKEANGANTSYFRGRKLQGRTIHLPEHYRGVVVEKTDKAMPANTKPSHPTPDHGHHGDELLDDDDEEPEEEIKVMQELATFDKIMVWGHDVVPSDLDDPYVKGIEEWMAFAQTMHSYGGDSAQLAVGVKA